MLPQAVVGARGRERPGGVTRRGERHAVAGPGLQLEAIRDLERDACPEVRDREGDRLPPVAIRRIPEQADARVSDGDDGLHRATVSALRPARDVVPTEVSK